MKTPRDLLLNRHRPALPKLDVIRRTVLAEHVGGPALPDEAPAGFLAQAWFELFWSCRRAWIGLAAAWILRGEASAAVVETGHVHAVPRILAALEVAGVPRGPQPDLDPPPPGMAERGGGAGLLGA